MNLDLAAVEAIAAHAESMGSVSLALDGVRLRVQAESVQQARIANLLALAAQADRDRVTGTGRALRSEAAALLASPAAAHLVLKPRP